MKTKQKQNNKKGTDKRYTVKSKRYTVLLKNKRHNWAVIYYKDNLSR